MWMSSTNVWDGVKRVYRIDGFTEHYFGEKDALRFLNIIG